MHAWDWLVLAQVLADAVDRGCPQRLAMLAIAPSVASAT